MDISTDMQGEKINEITTNLKEGMVESFDEMPLEEKSPEAQTPDDVKEEKLSPYENTVIKLEQPGWSMETIGYIESMEEYMIYREAGLEEKQVGDKVGLTRSDIDFSQKDEYGRTNAERIEAGLSPINKDGEVIELHHIGQKEDSPLAELTQEEHRGIGNDSVLHDKNSESEIDRVEFNKEKKEYWKNRLEMEG